MGDSSEHVQKQAEVALKRVMICDDDLDFAEECSDALKARGYDVVLRTPQSDFEKIVKAYRPQILLLDLYMPGPDGYEILKMIADRPSLHDIGIVVTSGAEEPLVRGIKAQCQAYGLRLLGICPKPIDLSALDDILARDDAHVPN
jgi:CheY-like chemotaxis protein